MNLPYGRETPPPPVLLSAMSFGFSVWVNMDSQVERLTQTVPGDGGVAMLLALIRSAFPFREECFLST